MGNNRCPYGKQSLSLWETIVVFMGNNRCPYGKQSVSLWETIVVLMGNNRYPYGKQSLLRLGVLIIGKENIDNTIIYYIFGPFQI
jgi:hypothetical protein